MLWSFISKRCTLHQKLNIGYFVDGHRLNPIVDWFYGYISAPNTDEFYAWNVKQYVQTLECAIYCFF